MINILKALADESRFNLIKVLLNHDYCVGALAKRLQLSESAVSQHLKILRSAGLVKGEKRGYFTHYSVDREILRRIAGELIELSSVIPAEKKCNSNLVQVQLSCQKEKKGGTN